MSETMLDYIKQTSLICKNNIANRESLVGTLKEEYINNNHHGITIVASGSSNNGSRLAQYFISHYLKCQCKILSPFTFYHHDHQEDGSMVICISQSGCSTNTLDCLKLLKEQNRRAIAIVGRDDCSARDIADEVINWQVGEEKIGFVTKGVVTLGLFLMLFALETAKQLNLIDNKQYDLAIEDIQKAVSLQDEMIATATRFYQNHKESLLQSHNIYFLSSGANLATASEAALKMAETSCINGFAIEAEEFLHGPMYPTSDKSVFFFIDNNEDDSSTRIRDIADACKTVTKHVYLLGQDNRFAENDCIATSDCSSYLTSPLYKLIALQVLAYYRTEDSNQYVPHENILKFKKENKVASKSRNNLYLNLQEKER